MCKVFIEGNIGTGKTTLLSLIISNKSKYTNFKDASIIYEPVEEWIALTDSDGCNILDKFYGSQSRWSFTFQINSFLSRHASIEKGKSNIKIIERSVYSDKNCFAKNCYNNGTMTELEYKIYNRWFDWLNIPKEENETHKFIYLKTSPKICFDRISKRNREEESSITIEYLEQIHNLHEEWLSTIDNLLVIDVSKNIYESETDQQKILEQINNFLD